MIKKRIYVLNICIPLTIGFIFYLLVRPDTILSKSIYKLLHMSPSLPLYELFVKNIVGCILINYLCDFLWAYALSWALFFIKDLYNYSAVRTVLYCIGTDCTMELLQVLDCADGTFDFYDILVQNFATLVVLALYKKLTNKGEEKND